MAGPNDVVGEWDFNVQPSAFGEFTTTFKLQIASVAVGGALSGQIKNGPALDKGKCVLGTNTGEVLMSFRLSLPGAFIFMAGVVTGSKPSCKFDGHYLLISQNALAAEAAVATLDDPGETGTGGGQQTT